MKKLLALLCVLALCLTALAGCGKGNASADPVTLRVVTSYGESDGNHENYQNAIKAWQAETGNVVDDNSASSNESWKNSVLTSFENGEEPDVLFFFSGVDANPLVLADQVVSLEEIREEYFNFASNMDENKISRSPVDGKIYAIPTNGYWEGLFVNKKVLAACGVEVPGPETTWDEFLQICETIKNQGYVPIAASINEVPHYWFEFCVLNNGSYAYHENVPEGPGTPEYDAWIAGLNDIRELYERGFFNEDTLTCSNNESLQLIAEDQAAFFIEGHWQLGWFSEQGLNLEDFTVTYVPGKNERRSTDMIGGLSMGYYITRTAWEDPEKREAAISFIRYMTSNENVNIMAAGVAATALRSGTAPPTETTPLLLDALEMVKNSTGTVPAVQDNLSQTVKQALLPDNMRYVVTGEMTPEQSVDDALSKM